MSRSLPELTIRTKLLVLALLPLLVLLGMVAPSVVEDLNRRADADRLVGLVQVAQRSTTLVHALQAERGATNTFVTSRGRELADKLPGLRQASDDAKAEAAAFLADAGHLPDDVRAAANGAVSAVDGLAAERASADKLERAPADYVGAYTKVIQGLLASLDPLARAATDPEMARELGAVSALSNAKENAGLQRAQLAGVFSKDEYAAGQQLRVNGLVSRREAFLTVFSGLAGADARRTVDAIRASKTMSDITAIEEVAFSKTSTFGQNPAAWFATATEYVDALRAAESSNLAEVESAAVGMRGEATRAVLFEGLLLLLIFAATIGLAYLTVRSIMRSLDAIKDVLAEVGKGHLDERYEGEQTDEIGEMGRSLNATLDSVESAMVRIRGAATRLDASASGLAGVSVELRDESESSAVEADEVSVAAGRVSENVDSLATSGQQLRAAIADIAGSAERSRTITQGAVAQAEEAATTVAALEETGERIGDVLKVVAAISEQTNLLALNATIEAARAGEAGKGFAVVASEVKDLAQETTNATEDIARRVEQLRGDTRAATTRIREVGQTVSEMEAIGATIAAAVEQQQATTVEIANHVTNAASETRAIAGRITHVADTSRRAKTTAADANSSAESLSGLAHELNDIVDQFRTRA
ncbi:MAG: methyl-accepting chemotaxis protein [Dermatophilus congolensis]|nr:methyl-accepting chemotaxis protein [Dermatophilus congolensis]